MKFIRAPNDNYMDGSRRLDEFELIKRKNNENKWLNLK